MAIKNPKDFLVQAAALPAAIEAKLPEGAPKISTMLTDATEKMPAVPDLPVEIPDLPVVPELPGVPGGLNRRVTVQERFITPTPTPLAAVKPLGVEILS